MWLASGPGEEEGSFLQNRGKPINTGSSGTRQSSASRLLFPSDLELRRPSSALNDGPLLREGPEPLGMGGQSAPQLELLFCQQSVLAGLGHVAKAQGPHCLVAMLVTWTEHLFSPINPTNCLSCCLKMCFQVFSPQKKTLPP